MHAAGHSYALLNLAEVGLLHQSALRILSEMGMEVQEFSLLSALAEAGLPVDFSSERVRFPSAYVEQFIAEAEKYDWAASTPRVSGSAGVYHSLYHDPASGELVPWTEEALASYFALAGRLPHVSGASMLGCRLQVPEPLEPLYERYYCWKYGAEEGSSIYLDELCPYIYELYQARASQQGLPLEQVFKGTVYLVPALKLGRHEACQVAYFRERGLRVGIGGSMFTMGANAPVTLAGVTALNLAEQLALRILDWVLFGVKRLHLHASIAPMDMRTTIRPFGRPEMAVANLLAAQLARFYGASFAGHAGLTDAKLPSVEAGAQKALSALPTLLAGGSVWLDAGLLSIDEVCSPIQLVLDDEFLSALSHFCSQFTINPDSLGLEAILEAGPGGHYLDKEHTAHYFRNEIWNPRLWSRQMLQPWLAEGGQLDSGRARDLVLSDQARGPLPSSLPEDLELEILAIIARAGRSFEIQP